MPQEFHVLRCYSCLFFQVQQVKKKPKWQCKVCSEKQSVKKVYGRGSGKDCRLLVQKLNSEVGDEAQIRGDHVEELGQDSGHLPIDHPHDPDVDNQVSWQSADDDASACQPVGTKWDVFCDEGDAGALEGDGNGVDEEDDTVLPFGLSSADLLTTKRPERFKRKKTFKQASSNTYSAKRAKQTGKDDRECPDTRFYQTSAQGHLHEPRLPSFAPFDEPSTESVASFSRIGQSGVASHTTASGQGDRWAGNLPRRLTSGCDTKAHFSSRLRLNRDGELAPAEKDHCSIPGDHRAGICIPGMRLSPVPRNRPLPLSNRWSKFIEPEGEDDDEEDLVDNPADVSGPTDAAACHSGPGYSGNKHPDIVYDPCERERVTPDVSFDLVSQKASLESCNDIPILNCKMSPAVRTLPKPRKSTEDNVLHPDVSDPTHLYNKTGNTQSTCSVQSFPPFSSTYQSLELREKRTDPSRARVSNRHSPHTVLTEVGNTAGTNSKGAVLRQEKPEGDVGQQTDSRSLFHVPEEELEGLPDFDVW